MSFYINNYVALSFWTVGFGTAKTSRKTKKNKKKTILNGLAQDSSHRIVYLFFLVFLEFLDSWAWDSKNLEKNQINQKKQS